MKLHEHFLKAAALLLAAAPIAAQDSGSCPASPGAAFGVVGFQCANCAFSRANGPRAVYSFLAEPVVTEVHDRSRLLAGDVIEAVNGQPITTRAGSDQFTYPTAGENTVTVRRGREHEIIRINVPSIVCQGSGRNMGVGASAGGGAGFGGGSGGSGTGAAAGAGFGSGASVGVAGERRLAIRGSARVDTVPLIVIDGVVQNGTAPAGMGNPARVGRYGFAVSCEPSCTAATDSDGPLMYTYYKYDEPPRIVAIRSGSPTDRAGVRIGDVLLRIDGHSIVDPEGALALARIDKKDSVRLTVRRDGKDVEYVVTAAR